MALMMGISLILVGAIFIVISLKGFDKEAGAPNQMIWNSIRKMMTNS